MHVTDSPAVSRDCVYSYPLTNQYDKGKIGFPCQSSVVGCTKLNLWLKTVYLQF